MNFKNLKNLKGLFLFAGALFFVLAGCEDRNLDKVHKAQACLDKAQTPTDGANCRSLASGLTGEQGARVRCGIEVLANGITQNDIVDGFKNMDSGSANPIAEMGTVFGLGDGNNVLAEGIRDVCSQSSSSGLRMISEMILFGTRAQTAFAGPTPTPADFVTAVGSMGNTEAGEMVESVWGIYCVPEFSNEKICSNLQNSGAGGTLTQDQQGACLKWIIGGRSGANPGGCS